MKIKKGVSLLWRFFALGNIILMSFSIYNRRLSDVELSEIYEYYFKK